MPIGTPTELHAETSDTNATSYAITFPTPSANALLLVSIIAIDAALSAPPNISSVSGLGLTWAEEVGADYSGIAREAVWRTLTGGSPSGGTVTITLDTTCTGIFVRVIEVTNVDTTGTAGSGAVVQSAVSTEDASTVTLGAFSDAGNGTLGMAVGNVSSGTITYTPGPGFTTLGVGAQRTDDDLGVILGWYAEYRTDNDTVVDATPTGADGSTNYMFGFEIKPAAAGGGSLLPMLVANEG